MAKRQTQRLSGEALDRRRAELAAAVEREFALLAPGAVQTLAAVAAAPPPPGARELLFEVFEAGCWLAVVYRVLGGGGFNEELAFGHVFDDATLQTVIDFGPADMAIEVEWRLVREALFGRLPGWWVEAAGAGYPLPVRLREHDVRAETTLAWAAAPVVYSTPD